MVIALRREGLAQSITTEHKSKQTPYGTLKASSRIRSYVVEHRLHHVHNERTNRGVTAVLQLNWFHNHHYHPEPWKDYHKPYATSRCRSHSHSYPVVASLPRDSKTTTVERKKSKTITL